MSFYSSTTFLFQQMGTSFASNVKSIMESKFLDCIWLLAVDIYPTALHKCRESDTGIYMLIEESI